MILLLSSACWAENNIPITMDLICKDPYFSSQDYCNSYRNLGEVVREYEKKMRNLNYGYYIALELGLIAARNRIEIKDVHTQMNIERNRVEFIYRREFP